MRQNEEAIKSELLNIELLKVGKIAEVITKNCMSDDTMRIIRAFYNIIAR